MLLGRHVRGDEGIVAHHADGFGRGFRLDSDFMKLAEKRFEMRGIASRDVQIAASHRAGNDERAGFDAVGNDAVLRAFQLAHTFHANGGRAGALDLRSHFIQQIGEVGDFRLARAVLQDGLAVGESRGHEQVFGAGDGDLVENNFCAFEAGGRWLRRSRGPG